jgi:rod shape-determining protein MreC
MRRFQLQQKRIIVLVIIILLILLYYITPLKSPLQALRNPLFVAGKPLYDIGAVVSSTWIGISRGSELLDEIEEKNNIITKLAKVEQSKSWEAEFLADVLKARVVAFSAKFGKNVLFINKGYSDGVSLDMPVITETGVLLGKIIELQPHLSLVLLVTDSGSTIAVTTQQNNAIQAIARGKLGASMTMELVNENEPLSIGDTVITSLLEEDTPRGLAVGTIGAIRTQEGELFKEAEINPLFSLSGLSDVGIITLRGIQ